MDLKIVMEWSISVLAVAGLIVYIRVRNNNRDKKNLAPLRIFARENNSEISQSDSWENVLIGIDGKEINKLFFIRKKPGNGIRELINLSEVSSCRMYKSERKLRENKEIVNVIDRIELIFTFYNHKPELSLELYNNDYDHLTLMGELQLAQKWTDIIKSVIGSNPMRLKPDLRKAKTA